MRVAGFVTVVFVAVLPACQDTTIVDDWPTFTVEGTVRTTAGTPAAHVGVLVRTFPGTPCEPDGGFFIALTRADASGRYATSVVDLAGTFRGCIAVRATDGFVHDTVEQYAEFADLKIEHRVTRVTVDLRFQ